MLLMGDDRQAVVDILDSLEAKVQRCVETIAAGPGAVAYSPDNLDGSFVSPRAFDSYLARSYRLASEVLSVGRKRLVVHAGGPASRLIAPLAAAGVAAVEGVSGPPQGDSTLAEARHLAGPDLCLWGGIPQDYLLGDVLGVGVAEDIERAVEEAVAQSRGDPRVLIGVADQVPPVASIDSLRRLGDLVASLA